MNANQLTAEAWPCTNDEYHADGERIGKSMMDVARRSMRTYEAIYVAKTLAPPETAAMRLGTLVHMAVLEPDKFWTHCKVPPAVDRRTKDGKKIYGDFLATVGPEHVVSSPDEFQLVVAINAAVQKSDVARKLLGQGGPIEQAIVWQDSESFLQLKSRRDKVLPGLLVDLKTTKDSSPEAFARSCHTFGYHRQASHYLSGHKAVFSEDAKFVFVAVSSDPPHQVAVYDLDEDAIRLGRSQNRQTLDRLAKAYEMDDWSDPQEGQITTLSLPRWAGYSDYQME